MIKHRIWWIATILQLVGVFMLASHSVNVVACYGIMLSGSFFGTSAAAVDKNVPLVLLNTGYSLANIVGIVRWS